MARAQRRRALLRIVRQARCGKLKTYLDTVDVSKFVKRYKNVVNSVSSKWLWGAAMFWRLYNRESTWKRLCHTGAVSVGRTPKWTKVEATLRRLYTEAFAKRTKVHGGLYYATKATHVSHNQGRTWVALPRGGHLSGAQRARRDRAGLEAMWAALPYRELAAFDRKPSRETFGEASDGWPPQMPHLGVWVDG